ncbi:uncharacterized protein LOC129575928 [Sitodiplosis mosellana]|uniref:uncharacterized protein LOC129575928 n=1 Tax=Sitodiplosis mosellana TaxID=263140 RepID=UPI002444CC0C|nr:uncharacterized protein LOC129575928 [Sitodiplosis mosellana]
MRRIFKSRSTIVPFHSWCCVVVYNINIKKKLFSSTQNTTKRCKIHQTTVNMWNIPFLVVLCTSLAFGHPQGTTPTLENKQTLDDLINQIFTQDNSGVSNQNSNQNQNGNGNTYPQQQTTIPTPVIVQGGGGGGVNGGGNGNYNNQNNQPYQPTPSNPPPYNPNSNPNANPCSFGECVPYYQCANGTIITDGEGLLDIRFGQEENIDSEKHPCPGLFETCCSLRSEKPMIPPETKVNTGCGIRNQDGVGFRITGDKDNEAQFGEFPWTVAILKEEKALDGQVLNVYVCGGSLIDAGVVLTAAHCVDKKDPQILKIRAGEWDTQTKDEIFPHQDRQVRDYVIHPEYYRGGLYNDVALLFLTEPVEIAENVNIACLPTQNDVFDHARCFASGWGKDLFGKEGKYQVILKRVELPIVPRALCVQKLRETRLGKHFILHESFICAGGERGRDTCKGDGGSPLVCPVLNAPGRYAQAGIVAWGIGCGDETPGVYVNVPAFRYWIDEQMKLKHYTNVGYNVKTYPLIAIISLTVIYAVNATPQRNRWQRQQNEDPALQDAIDMVFNTPNRGQQQQQQQSTTQSSRGVGVVVTPDPTYVPTTAPQTLTVNEQNCTCVPYHLCDPITNTVRENQSNNDEVTGFGLIDIRFDPLDCVDVLDVCCVGGAQREESIVPKPNENVPTQEAGCGVRNVGGLDFELAGAFDNEAGFGEFPWTVCIILIEEDTCICGGSLIHPKAVLTGFHCVKDYVLKARDLKIRAGEWDTQTTKERLPYQERIVSRIFGHPNYNERSLANDIAIIELEDPFQMDRHISTVCLPPPGFVPNQKDCFASGWGKDNFGQAGRYSVIMKKVPLDIVDRNQCERALQVERLGDKFRLDGSFICAGGVEGVDTCQGDGGAPLVCPIGRPSDNRFAQNGIVAWGLGCKKPIPAVYANVAQARDWIDGQVRFIGLDTNYYTFRS